MTDEHVIKVLSSGIMGFLLASMLLVYLYLWVMVYQAGGILGILFLAGFHLLAYGLAYKLYTVLF